MYTSIIISSFIVLGAHVIHALPHSIEDISHINHRDAASFADGISIQEAADAFPPRDIANITNWFGTSLYGWNKCDEMSSKLKDWIKEAYSDANKLANQDGVKQNIDWESAAAFEFLGPSALNKDQQSQIQAVLTNMATVKEGSSLWTPNWIRARCDDPNRICSTQCPQPGQPNPKSVLAYARNPGNNGNDEKYPDINFCIDFFALRNLDDAMAFGQSRSNPRLRFDLDNYVSRASAFLHELFHLDIAADSVKENPNPHVRDLKIRITLDNTGRRGWVKAYGAKLSKVLARFVPISSASKQTGYFVQRNVDNFVGFTLARYVQAALGGYPFLPILYDKLADAPMLPPNRNDINSIVYSTNGVSPAIFSIGDGNLVDGPGFLSMGGECPIIQPTDVGVAEDLEIGEPFPPSMIPAGYANDRFKFLSSIGGTDNPFPSAPPCSIEVKEIWTCGEPTTNLYASVSIKDPNGAAYYVTPQSVSSPGQPIDDGHPLSIKNDSMQYDMIITGEHQNDYIRFNYGDLAWKSDTSNGTATCKLNGDNWDAKGPQGCPTLAQTRSFTCQYPCNGKMN